MILDANIVVCVRSKFLYNRVDSLFRGDRSIRLLESTYVNDCITKIENLGTNLSCVIIDDDCEEREALNEIANIRKALNPKIPLLLISSGQKLTFFSLAVNQGVNDIIVKPFNDEFLKDRICKLLSKNRCRNVEIVSISLFKYLNGELRKAQKGKYPLSFMLTTVQFVDEEQYSDDEKTFYLDAYFNCLKGLFWDTDLFIKFDSKYYLGVFPFCDVKNAQIIYNKNAESFEKLISDNILPSDCKMAVSFVSYPDNMKTVVDGFKELMKIIKNDYMDSELEIHFNEIGTISL